MKKDAVIFFRVTNAEAKFYRSKYGRSLAEVCRIALRSFDEKGSDRVVKDQKVWDIIKASRRAC